MKQPAISVAMATYNGERFLQEQLDSLARQTLLPCELVACDDGSTDGTLGILRTFAAKAPFPVRIHQNERRLGFGFNFLGALSRCTGDLVAFCDQDDIWKDGKLEVCAEALENPEVAMVSHSALVMSSPPLPRRMRHPDHRPSVYRSCRDLPMHRWPIPGFSVVLRRAVLDRAPVPEYSAPLSSGCAHDGWATLAALSCGCVALLPDELAYYRLHDVNSSMRAPLTGLARLAPDHSTLERYVDSGARVSRFLRYAASFCDGPARATFNEWIARSERIRGLYRDRAKLHRSCGRPLAAITVLARMMAKGDYGPRRLGAKAFVRDLLLATVWPGRSAGPRQGTAPEEPLP